MTVLSEVPAQNELRLPLCRNICYLKELQDFQDDTSPATYWVMQEIHSLWATHFCSFLTLLDFLYNVIKLSLKFYYGGMA